MSAGVEESALLAMSYEVAAIITAARELNLDDVANWASHAAHIKSHHDAAGAILDPTAWQRNHKGIDATAQVARAFLAFRRVIDEVSA